MWMSNVVSAGSSELGQHSEDRLVIKSGGRVVFIGVHEIDWIQAAANYVRLYCTGKQPLLFRKPISQLAEQLDNSRFLRIHRSYIVNASRIRELQPCNSGEFIVSLRDGKELPCSRTYRRALQALYSPRHA